ncbi:MAG: gliding motility-associated C-terminal domain-containing protein, partial [Bacteroidota bacterium]
ATAMTCVAQDTGVFQSTIAGPLGCDTILITTVSWDRPDTTFATALTCVAQDTGVFQSTIAGPLGCDTILITTVSWDQPDTTFATAMTCVAQDTGVFQSTIAGPLGCDTILITTVSWDRPDTTFATAMTCVAQDTGVFQSTIAGPLGCDTILITTVTWDRPDTTFATALTCVAQDTGVFQSTIAGPLGCDTILITTVTWDRPDTTFATALTCVAQDTGVFQSTIAGPLGCDTIIITTVTWDRPDTTFATALTCVAQDTGVFQSTIAGPLGCDTILLTRVTLTEPDTLWQTTQSCNPLDVGERMTQQVDEDGCVLITITTTSLIQGGVGRRQVFSCDTADFGLDTLIISNANCDSLFITETVGNPPISFSLQANPVPCGPRLGSIQITEITGGSGNYTYQLNDAASQATPFFTGLNTGSYRVSIIDEEGCVSTQNTLVAASPEPFVDLGEDRSIRWGDSTLVRLRYGNTPQAVARITYSDGQCNDCFDRWFAPLETTDYGVTVVDTFGCIARDQFRITVEKPDGIFIPNAFSPNGDGVNDAFIVFGDPTIVTRLTDLRIFSRWGEPVHTVSTAAVNDPGAGWDGNHRGEKMNSGVFVYTFTAHFIDGSERRYRGELVLVR